MNARLTRLLPWVLLAAPLVAVPLGALASDSDGGESGTPPVPDRPVERPPQPALQRVPARSPEEAKLDPRFVRQSLQGDARVRISRVLVGYPYFGIPNNGCSAGTNYFGAELLAPFDDLPIGTSVVLRIEDATLGPATSGASLAFSNLRRAGKGPDGTFVYCGRGSAFQIRQ